MEIIRFLILSILIFTSTTSQALIFEIDKIYNSTSFDGAYLDEGTYTFSFDINSILNANYGTDYSNYDFLSGQLHFSFTDDDTGNWGPGDYTGDSWDYIPLDDRNSLYDRYEHRINESESASVTTSSGTNISGSTPYHSEEYWGWYFEGENSYWVDTGGYWEVIQCWGVWIAGECIGYLEKEWVDTGYMDSAPITRYQYLSGQWGDFSLDLLLTSEDLLSLAIDGILNYQIDVEGDLILKNTRLTLELEEKVNESTDSTVPLPTPLALLVIGLASIGLIRKRKMA
jgi:hypothetical protein